MLHVFCRVYDEQLWPLNNYWQSIFDRLRLFGFPSPILNIFPAPQPISIVVRDLVYLKVFSVSKWPMRSSLVGVYLVLPFFLSRKYQISTTDLKFVFISFHCYYNISLSPPWYVDIMKSYKPFKCILRASAGFHAAGCIALVINSNFPYSIARMSRVAQFCKSFLQAVNGMRWVELRFSFSPYLVLLRVCAKFFQHGSSTQFVHPSTKEKKVSLF